MPRLGFYAVHQGRKIGIFTNWDLCSESVKYYPGAKYQKFKTLELAITWLDREEIIVYTEDGWCTLEQFTHPLPVVNAAADSVMRQLQLELSLLREMSETKINSLQRELDMRKEVSIVDDLEQVLYPIHPFV
jgi:viroplasmin and RNaseH domain-containing protein